MPRGGHRGQLQPPVVGAGGDPTAHRTAGRRRREGTCRPGRTRSAELSGRWRPPSRPRPAGRPRPRSPRRRSRRGPPPPPPPPRPRTPPQPRGGDPPPVPGEGHLHVQLGRDTGCPANRAIAVTQADARVGSVNLTVQVKLLPDPAQ